jgi:hypothetical protein
VKTRNIDARCASEVSAIPASIQGLSAQPDAPRRTRTRIVLVSQRLLVIVIGHWPIEVMLVVLWCWGVGWSPGWTVAADRPIMMSAGGLVRRIDANGGREAR